MTITNRVSLKSVNGGNTPIADVVDAPTIGTATDLGTGTSVTVGYTAAATGGAATSFTAISTPSSITGTGASPITVSGLTAGTAYTFKVYGTNAAGVWSGVQSAASNSVTPILANDFESIATATVGAGGASTITFSSIPQTYQHLQLRIMCKNTSVPNAGDFATMRFNGDSGMNYTYRRMKGDGSTATSYGAATGTFDGVTLERIATSKSGVATQTHGVLICDILDYANTNKNTTTRTLGGYDSNGAGEILFTGSLWINTAAISSITLTTPETNFTQYSSFALYGIKG